MADGALTWCQLRVQFQVRQVIGKNLDVGCPEIRWNPGRGSRNPASLPGRQDIQGNVNGPVTAHLVQPAGLGACHWLLSGVPLGPAALGMAPVNYFRLIFFHYLIQT